MKRISTSQERNESRQEAFLLATKYLYDRTFGRRDTGVCCMLLQVLVECYWLAYVRPDHHLLAVVLEVTKPQQKEGQTPRV